jgi:hypothetical protein
MAWFAAEHRMLLAAVQQAHQAGLDALAWQLARLHGSQGRHRAALDETRLASDLFGRRTTARGGPGPSTTSAGTTRSSASTTRR